VSLIIRPLHLSEALDSGRTAPYKRHSGTFVLFSYVADRKALYNTFLLSLIIKSGSLITCPNPSSFCLCQLKLVRVFANPAYCSSP